MGCYECFFVANPTVSKQGLTLLHFANKKFCSGKPGLYIVMHLNNADEAARSYVSIMLFTVDVNQNL